MGKDKRAWRKLVKKLRRKRIRRKLATILEEGQQQRQQICDDDLNGDGEMQMIVDTCILVDENSVKEDDAGDIEVEPDTGYQFFITETEWTNRQQHSDLLNVMRQSEEERVAKARADEEKRIREEWAAKESQEKAEREEKEREEELRRKKQASLTLIIMKLSGSGQFSVHWMILVEMDEEYNSFLDFLCGDVETPPLPYVMPEGYDDTGKEVCQQFLKTGACRFFLRCKLFHPNPTLSRTILIPNFFSHFSLDEGARDEYDTDLGLEYENSELQKQFLEFYDDVLPEFRKHGKVIQFKVCRNFETHLRGNVYVQYENIRSAVEAYRTFNARFYNGKQISLQFVRIESWKTAICWSFLRRHCVKGKSCNYLHVFRNPTKEFVQADRDWKEFSTFQAPSMSSAGPSGSVHRKNHPERSETTTTSLTSSLSSKSDSDKDNSSRQKESDRSKIKPGSSHRKQSKRTQDVILPHSTSRSSKAVHRSRDSAKLCDSDKDTLAKSKKSKHKHKKHKHKKKHKKK